MAKAIDKVQRVLTSQCKSIEEKGSNLSVESTTMDTSSTPDNDKYDTPRDVDSHAVKHSASDVYGILKEIEDHNQREPNFLIYNLPEVTGPNHTGVDAKVVESIVQKNLSISGAKINKVTRLGKPKENSPRPLVSMVDEGRYLNGNV